VQRADETEEGQHALTETTALMGLLRKFTNWALGINVLIVMGGVIVALLDDLKVKLEQLRLDIAAEKTEVQAMLKALHDQIKALQDQIAAGQNVTAEDLQGLITTVTELDAGVTGISEPEPVADIPDNPPA